MSHGSGLRTRGSLYADEFASLTRALLPPASSGTRGGMHRADDVVDIMLEVDVSTYLPAI